MKSILSVFVTGATTFTAGWFLKPLEPAPAALSPNIARVVAAVPVAGDSNPFRKALHGGNSVGGAAIEPYRSIDEIVSLMQGLMEDEDELGPLEMAEAFPRLMVTDLATVRAMLEEMKTSSQGPAEARTAAVAMLVGRWILQEPEAATGYILANPVAFAKRESGMLFADDEVNKALRFFGVAMTARKHPAAARLMLGLLPEETGGELSQMLMQMEGKADPEKFLTTASPEMLEEADNITALVRRWARRDPQAAVDWAEASEHLEGEVWPAIATSWAEKDREGAIAWANSLTTDKDRQRSVMEAIATQTASALGGAALDEALEAFPPDVAALVRLRHFPAGNENTAGGAALVEKLLTQYSDDAEIARAAAGPASTVVSQLLKEESGSSKAAEWVTALPEGEARANAASTLIGTWAAEDPAAASSWIRELPEGETRKEATIQLISGIRSEDPVSAIEWAKSISNPTTRLEQVHLVLRGWLQNSPRQAMEALEQFPPEEQEEMFGE